MEGPCPICLSRFLEQSDPMDYGSSVEAIFWSKMKVPLEGELVYLDVSSFYLGVFVGT